MVCPQRKLESEACILTETTCFGFVVEHLRWVQKYAMDFGGGWLRKITGFVPFALKKRGGKKRSPYLTL